MNAKLTDYGIACYATAAGLTQSVGTPGYRAPELLMSTSSFMPYYYKVDICYAYIVGLGLGLRLGLVLGLLVMYHSSCIVHETQWIYEYTGCIT